MTVASAVYDVLTANDPINAIATGGIWTRALKRKGDGATPEAFAATGQLMPAIVVRDNGDQADSSGLPEAYQSFPQIWLYGPTTAAGRTAIGQMVSAAIILLHGRVLRLDDGKGSQVFVAGRLGVNDDPGMADALVDMLRLQGDGVWI